MKVNWSRSLLLSGVATVFAVAGASPALAAAEAGAIDANDAETIIVTGSRIAKAGFEAPTPTTVIDATVLTSAPQPNVAQNLNQLPALSGSTSPRTAGNGVVGGTQGANFLNLRNLGANRTLILLDRRRVVAAATTGAVDLNLLPTTLLKQVDVVTGGASAAWGSDAVAGVVNLVLDKKFTGLKGSIQKGISTYGDADEFRVDLAGGHEFAGGRGHIVASASYAQAGSVDMVTSRPWFVGTKLFNNPAYVAGNGQPKLIVADHVNASTATIGGLITGWNATNLAAPTLIGTQFLAGGVAAPFNFGTIGTNVGGLGALNGSYGASQLSRNGTPNDLSEFDQIIASNKQVSTFLRASYDVSDAINVYGEFIYGRSEADSLSVPYLTMAPNGSPLTIRRNNAYLPPSIAAAMDAAGATQITLGRYNLDLGLASPHNERQLYRYLVGTDIDLGGSWKAQVYYEHGLSKVLNESSNNAIVSNFALSVNAVRDANNNIVCAATLNPASTPTPSAGCVPFNVFGPQNLTAAQRAWLVGTARQNISLTQDVVSASITGDLFALPAGSVSIAAGAEYRKENHRADADPNSVQNNTNSLVPAPTGGPDSLIAPGNGNWWVGNYKPSKGGYNVKEAFGEILVPVFKDSPIGRQLDLNAAVRVTNYSTSGTVTTWKVGGTYDIAGGFKVRSVLSRDIRAPNLGEYFLGGTVSSVAVLDGVTNTPGVLRIQQGNTALKPEVAKTFTAGAIFQPQFLPGFSVSFDYYYIKINGSIGTLTAQQTVDRCNGGNTAICALVLRDNGVITTILAKPVNFRTEVEAGFDVEAAYRFALGAGRVTLRSLWTYTGKRYLNDNGVIDSQLGEVAQSGGPVKLRGFNSVTYDSDRWNFSVRHRLIGQGVLDAAWTAADVSSNEVPAVHYIDLSATAKVQSGGVNFEVFGAVDNLFNVSPPRAPQTGGNPNTNIGTAAAIYDLVGRYFRAGVRFKI